MFFLSVWHHKIINMYTLTIRAVAISYIFDFFFSKIHTFQTVDTRDLRKMLIIWWEILYTPLIIIHTFCRGFLLKINSSYNHIYINFSWLWSDAASFNVILFNTTNPFSLWNLMGFVWLDNLCSALNICYPSLSIYV